MTIVSVTDEIDQNPEVALRIGVGAGLRHFELRKANGMRFPDYSDETFDLLARWRNEYGVEYTAVSPGFFKRPEAGQRETMFARTRELGVGTIIVFAPKPSTGYEEAVGMARDLCAKAGSHGFAVLLENSANTLCGSADGTAALIREVGAANLAANWDPANAVSAGSQDTEEEYGKVSPVIGGVHVKDPVPGPEGGFRYVPAGVGIVDYPKLLENLKRDGYSGNLTVETHCQPPRGPFEESLRYLRRLTETA